MRGDRDLWHKRLLKYARCPEELHMVYNRLEQTVELSSKYIIKIICKADDFNKTSVQLQDIFTKIFFSNDEQGCT